MERFKKAKRGKRGRRRFIDSLSLQRGAMSIEAALSISIYLIVMISWLFLFRLMRMEGMMQHALNQTVLSLSDQLTYLSAIGERGDQAISYLEEKIKSSKSEVEMALVKVGKELSDAYLSSLLCSFVSDGISSEQLASGGVERGCNGVDWRVDLNWEEGFLRLSIDYHLTPFGILAPFGTIPVHQSASTGLWKLPGAQRPVLGETASEEIQSDAANSIWQKGAWERGRFFAEWRRKSMGGGVRTGHGIDRWQDPGMVEEVFSIQVFSDSYARGSGNDPMSYRIDEVAMEKRMASYCQKIKKDVQKQPQIVLLDGRTLRVPPHCAMQICLIMPEEAALHRHRLEQAAQKAAAQEGVRIQILFREKAFISRQRSGKDGK